MNTTREVVEVFGAVRYPVPKLGEHGSWSCTFGSHWWSVLRSEATGAVVAVACGACRKLLAPVHDLPPAVKEGAV